MTQDFNLLIESYFQSIMDSSDLVPLPIALVDENLTQFWENQYLKDRYPVQQGQCNFNDERI